MNKHNQAQEYSWAEPNDYLASKFLEPIPAEYEPAITVGSFNWGSHLADQIFDVKLILRPFAWSMERETYLVDFGDASDGRNLQPRAVEGIEVESVYRQGIPQIVFEWDQQGPNLERGCDFNLTIISAT